MQGFLSDILNVYFLTRLEFPSMSVSIYMLFTIFVPFLMMTVTFRKEIALLFGIFVAVMHAAAAAAAANTADDDDDDADDDDDVLGTFNNISSFFDTGMMKK